ncbi:hypothetical protein J437_LFUL013264 [Ladona fulva]|uniref:Chitin-binding type-2 domain-containing protein n=1 Tax=Ladona fulva TaxID=123851 RepID=A0A8K0P2B1_LADFU|nr:hypothetical protein J437_LFUL013264 [Ladona fulva]
MCSSGNAWAFNCPAHLYFNQTICMCEDKYTVNCQPTVTPALESRSYCRYLKRSFSTIAIEKETSFGPIEVFSIVLEMRLYFLEWRDSKNPLKEKGLLRVNNQL